MPSSYIGRNKLMAITRAAAAVGLTESAHRLEAKIKEDAPIDEGTLRGGVHPEPPTQFGNGVEVIVSTGAESSDYAIRQHEGEGFAHPRGGNAKYVERPLMAHGPDHLRSVARAVKAAL